MSKTELCLQGICKKSRPMVNYPYISMPFLIKFFQGIEKRENNFSFVRKDLLGIIKWKVQSEGLEK